MTRCWWPGARRTPGTRPRSSRHGCSRSPTGRRSRRCGGDGGRVPDATSTPTQPAIEPNAARRRAAAPAVARAARRALAALSAEHRAVMELTYYQGYSCREIAEIIGCPVATVKTRMFYARRKMRTLLAQRGAGAVSGRVLPFEGSQHRQAQRSAAVAGERKLGRRRTRHGSSAHVGACVDCQQQLAHWRALQASARAPRRRDGSHAVVRAPAQSAAGAACPPSRVAVERHARARGRRRRAGCAAQWPRRAHCCGARRRVVAAGTAGAIPHAGDMPAAARQRRMPAGGGVRSATGQARMRGCCAPARRASSMAPMTPAPTCWRYRPRASTWCATHCARRPA